MPPDQVNVSTCLLDAELSPPPISITRASCLWPLCLGGCTCLLVVYIPSSILGVLGLLTPLGSLLEQDPGELWANSGPWLNFGRWDTYIWPIVAESVVIYSTQLSFYLTPGKQTPIRAIESLDLSHAKSTMSPKLHGTHCQISNLVVFLIWTWGKKNHPSSPCEGGGSHSRAISK